VAAPTAQSIHGALLRYRVMAFVVGVTLLVFCGFIFAKYVLDRGDDQLIAQLHGFLFMIYAIVSLDLGLRMRWSFGRLALMVVAGMIPFLSFVMEHKAVQWVRAEVSDAAPASPASPAPPAPPAD
jgi:integral membrane protein